MAIAEDILAAHRDIADTLERVGPEAPAGVDGWTAEDLAAHLRTQVGGTGVAIFLGRSLVARGVRLGDWTGSITERALAAQRKRGFRACVEKVREGPPRLLLHGRVAPVTLFEVWLHHDDLRRANGLDPADPARSLGLAVEAALRYQRAALGDAELDRTVGAADLVRWLGGRPSALPPHDPPLRF